MLKLQLEAVSKPFRHAFWRDGHPPPAVGVVKPSHVTLRRGQKETSGSTACDPGGLASSEGAPYRSLDKLRASTGVDVARACGQSAAGGECSGS